VKEKEIARWDCGWVAAGRCYVVLLIVASLEVEL
jgi:hypothetical protein